MQLQTAFSCHHLKAYLGWVYTMTHLIGLTVEVSYCLKLHLQLSTDPYVGLYRELSLGDWISYRAFIQTLALKGERGQWT